MTRKKVRNSISPKENLRLRGDYLEGYKYVNGVKDENGKIVIRPLTDKEREWLNKFEAETVGLDFEHTQPILDAKNALEREVQNKIRFIEGRELEMLAGMLTDAKSMSNLKARRSRQEQINRKIRQIESSPKPNILNKIRKYLVLAQDYKSIKKLKKKLIFARNKYNLYTSQKDRNELTNDNNKRTDCLFNRQKVTGNLVYLDITEQDRFVSERLESIDPKDFVGLDET